MNSLTQTLTCIVQAHNCELKGLRRGSVVNIALHGNPSQNYGASSPAIWDNTPGTCHPTQENTPHLNPSQKG